MTIAATERNRYQNVYTSRIWDVSDGNGGENFEERMIDQIQQFFKELGTMNLLAQDHGVEPVSYTHLDVYKRQS